MPHVHKSLDVGTCFVTNLLAKGVLKDGYIGPTSLRDFLLPFNAINHQAYIVYKIKIQNMKFVIWEQHKFVPSFVRFVIKGFILYSYVVG